MIAYAECEFHLPHSHSLKEKRAVLQRVLSRVKQKYNVSISEIDYQDTWQRAGIAIVAVASSKQVAEREIQRTLSLMDSFPEWERTNLMLEFL
ncbi:DUF503 domain-containing protein [Jeotgalibacillus soli]|uniref:YlxP-like protein n=1 Tax=Jeotgalibacillus soli TaxID=889306 RepID=A0A0C2RT56_9BACL|nr:DUF503 family protein [Jeotgalibacillus soli]KIL44929.1 hypothetical protein KP78_24730 [Jeotgalibacillus soli]